MSTQRLGDVSIPVGFYLDRDDKQKRRGRKIGDLFNTPRDDGSPGYWIKLHADALAPSLLILLSRNGFIEKGEDGVILNVYPPRDEKPRQPATGEPAGGDAAAKDDIPF